ncbi:FAD-binding oxidoreductase [Bdellovibrio sp. HCB2-146]|uniref:FAD-binding oxidoreductase n=1 Tax=Bdellovibrio sp. HCB2-146 TaxID=3394362 RepID=UPI0039BC2525
MQSKTHDFLNSLKTQGLSAIIADESLLADVKNNVGSFERTVPAILKVSTKEQVDVIVKAANQHKVALFPFSIGKNWGYGSKLPTQSDSVLLDLSALNKIISIDEEQGLAHIEPGVTQAQLSQELLHRKSKYYVDVTGSGADTSILGNSLERGIAYQGIRATQITHLEVLLGNGTLLNTGFGDYPTPVLKGLYSYGLGPSLDGLFFQSSFGVVLQGAIKLNLRPEKSYALSLSVNNERLSELINSLTELRRNGTIQGIPHVANRERTVSTFIPLLQEKDPSLTAEKAREILGRAITGDWALTVSVGGPAALADVRLQEVKKKLKPLGRIFVQSLQNNSFKSKMQSLLISLFASTEQKSVLAAAEKLRGLHHGQASNAGVQFLMQNGNVDTSKEGFLLCTPLAPLTGTSAQMYLDTLNAHAQKYPVKLAMTLNIITEQILEAVISVHFNREDAQEVEQAHACVRSLTESFSSRGYYPYRVNIDQIKDFTGMPVPHWDLVRKIKSVLDPNGIIAPGRYN